MRRLGRVYTHRKSDWDIVASQDAISARGFAANYNGRETVTEVWKSTRIEWHNPEHLFNGDIKVSPGIHAIIPSGEFIRIATPEYLYMVKRSHIWRPIKFAHHMGDMQWLKERGYIPADFKEHPFYRARLSETKRIYGDRHPSLMKSNDEFFDDSVNKVYVHDDLHRIVAFGDQPVYETMKKDPESAMCDKDLWNQLPHDQQIKAVQEEAMVIALERFLIPSMLGKLARPVKERPAFLMALEKICTTLCSGWFRDFAIDNYGECQNLSVSPLQLFQNGEHKCRKLK